MDYPRTATLIEQVKAILGIDDKQDNILNYAVSKVVNDVANYCNIDRAEIPEQLDQTMISILITFIQTHDLIISDNDNGIPKNAQSITEGTTSVSFKTTAQIYSEIQAANPITDDYRNQLNHFRKIKP